LKHNRSYNHVAAGLYIVGYG